MTRASARLGLKLVIRCRDFETAHGFYRDILELPVLEQWTEDAGKGCIFGFGETGDGGWLEIYEMTEEDPRYDLAYSRPMESDKIDLQLQTSSLDDWLERLADRWPFDGPQTMPWGHRWIKFRDPDNLLIAIYEDLR